MNNEKGFFIVTAVLVAFLVFACTGWAGIAVRIKNRLVPTVESLENDYSDMVYYRDERLVLPECPGEDTMKIYRKTVKSVAQKFRTQGGLIQKYRSYFAEENVDKMLSVNSQIEMNWGYIKADIREYEFACQNQCKTPIKKRNPYNNPLGQSGSSNGSNTSELAPLAEAGMSLLNTISESPVEKEGVEIPTELPSKEPTEVTIPDISIDEINNALPQIREGDPWLSEVGKVGILGVLKSIIGIGAATEQSPAANIGFGPMNG